MNNDMFFRKREVNELVVLSDEVSPRATGAKNNSLFQFSGVSVSSAVSIVCVRASAADIRADFGIILGIFEVVRRSFSR